MHEKTLQTPRSAKREGMLQAHGGEHGEGGCPTAAHEGPWCNTFTQQPLEEPRQSRQRGHEEAGAHGKLLLEQAPGRSSG